MCVCLSILPYQRDAERGSNERVCLVEPTSEVCMRGAWPCVCVVINSQRKAGWKPLTTMTTITRSRQLTICTCQGTANRY